MVLYPLNARRFRSLKILIDTFLQVTLEFHMRGQGDVTALVVLSADIMF